MLGSVVRKLQYDQRNEKNNEKDTVCVEEKRTEVKIRCGREKERRRERYCVRGRRKERGDI